MGNQPVRCAALLLAIGIMWCASVAARNSSDMSPAPPPATQTTRPAWIDQDPAQWPQILCSNEIHYVGSTEIIEGAGAFLMRLPDGVVVAGTAKHVAAETILLADFDKKVRSYFLYSHADPKKKILLGKLAVDPKDVENLDWAVMSIPNQRGPWPAEVLTARDTPLEIGESVYLIGEPRAEKGPQHVYSGIVRARERNDFIFQVDTRIEQTLGLSGSPIVDAEGRLAAVYTGHLTEQNSPGKTDLVGLDTARVLKFINTAPAGVAGSPGRGLPPGPVTQPVRDLAAEAEAALRGARLFVDNHIYDRARERLQSIIKTYPDTPAAKQAAELLRQIDGK